MPKPPAAPSPERFEKLGQFYLGRTATPDGGGGEEGDLFLYDSKDLTTHAVCVGMTGSGKTGLCVGLLEEAAIDGIPSIVIDVKGDLGNLLLTFPKLRPDDFLPWIDEGEAQRKGKTKEQLAAATAELWRNGLASWGQDGKRIERLRAAADFALYTPGSDAGRPVTVLRSFDAPAPAIQDDAEAFRGRVQSAVSGLLALLGLNTDPVRSREHILLSTILDRAWREGKNLDLPALVHAVQAPGFDRIGVMDLESVYPASERFGLAMSLNNLLASPGFAAWMEGEPLDVSRLLWTDEGKPRVAIVSIAHLSDAERMFFVTILLNEVLTWMRAQPGTGSLRALLYMDEVFGYFPPTANPPSKTPMLTLLKQARAFGVGCVLATQNPVDLDYKGLSNAGTWFLGRLQTERDKARVLDGLEGASAAAGRGFDRARTEAILSGLESRTFLVNNVHEDAPVLFKTRWVLSYLRGPMTRTQIRALRGGAPAPAAAARAAAARKEKPRPTAPAGVKQRYLEANVRAPRDARLLYRPALASTVELHYANRTAKIDDWKRVVCLAPLDGTADVWRDARILPDGDDRLVDEPEPDATYAELPPAAARAKSWPSWRKKLETHAYREFPLTLSRCRALKLVSGPDEDARDFAIRLREAARETRDAALEKLRDRYTPKLRRLEERIRKAEAKIEREESQYGEKKASSAISIGATILGALFGRKVASTGTVGRAATSIRSIGRASKEKDDIRRAKADRDALAEQLADLEREFRGELDDRAAELEPDDFEIEELVVRPRKADLDATPPALAWVPYWIGPDGVAEPASTV